MSGVMAKYDPLRSRLGAAPPDPVALSFAEIEALVGGLPASASRYSAWWENETNGRHVQAHAWLAAGRCVEEIHLGEWVLFSARR